MIESTTNRFCCPPNLSFLFPSVMKSTLRFFSSFVYPSKFSIPYAEYIYTNFDANFIEMSNFTVSVLHTSDVDDPFFFQSAYIWFPLASLKLGLLSIPIVFIIWHVHVHNPARDRTRRPGSAHRGAGRDSVRIRRESESAAADVTWTLKRVGGPTRERRQAQLLASVRVRIMIRSDRRLRPGVRSPMAAAGGSGLNL